MPAGRLEEPHGPQGRMQGGAGGGESRYCWWRQRQLISLVRCLPAARRVVTGGQQRPGAHGLVEGWRESRGESEECIGQLLGEEGLQARC
jgi:hypothetical protein